METTNYYNTFIEIAEDSTATSGEIPPVKRDKKSVANLQYEMLVDKPYHYTSDDVLFAVFAQRKNIPANELDAQREVYFSKGQPCFRASPLTKRYGWGVHSNVDGKIAIYGVETHEYQQFIKDGTLQKKKAMRSKRK